MSTTKAKVKLKPLADRVLIRVLDESEQTSGGIYLPDTAREKPQKGEILAVGSGRLNETSGQREKLEVEIGQVILFSKYGGTDIKIDGEEYKILSERDILGILVD